MELQKNECWYVLFVKANHENKVKEIIENELKDQFQVIIPIRELKERKDGKWRKVKRKLFPGYVFLKGIIDTEVYNKIKRIPSIIKLLKNDKEILTVDERELKVLKILIDNEDNSIGISQLYKEDDKIKIISGPLIGLEGQIVKVNKRKGRAKVRLSFMDEERVVDLGVEVVDKL